MVPHDFNHLFSRFGAPAGGIQEEHEALGIAMRGSDRFLDEVTKCPRGPGVDRTVIKANVASEMAFEVNEVAGHGCFDAFVKVLHAVALLLRVRIPLHTIRDYEILRWY
jgi:hypothetical protein